MHNIIVTEKDIFDFVFHRATLKWLKIKQIMDNPFLLEIAKSYEIFKEYVTEDELDNSIKTKLNNKIEAYKYDNKIELIPFNHHKFQEMETTNYQNIFVDKEFHFILRELKTKEKVKFNLFSTCQSKVENLNLHFLPSDYSFYLKDNNNPFEINEFLEIEKIELEYN